METIKEDLNLQAESTKSLTPTLERLTSEQIKKGAHLTYHVIGSIRVLNANVKPWVTLEEVLEQCNNYPSNYGKITMEELLDIIHACIPLFCTKEKKDGYYIPGIGCRGTIISIQYYTFNEHNAINTDYEPQK